MKRLSPRFHDPIKDNTYRVIDGDTIEVELDRGWKEDKVVSLRLYGLNTPENKNTRDGGALEKEAGDLCKEVVERWCLERNLENKQLYHTSEARPKFFGRTIGYLFAETPDTSLNAYMLANKLCKEYFGDARAPWTEAELNAIILRARAILSE